MSGWQPIDSAPRDGRPLLLYSPGCEGIAPKMRVDRWHDASEGRGYTGWGEFNMRHWPPTHWMPLPEPPA